MYIVSLNLTKLMQKVIFSFNYDCSYLYGQVKPD
jgi:hypothetical protein